MIHKTSLILYHSCVHSHTQIIDAALSNANETLPSNGTSTNGDQPNDALASVAVPSPTLLLSSESRVIPTAIVKPKYQKTSFDDRQLPPVANVDREKPWYEDDTNVSDTVITLMAKKVEQLPPFERKPTKHLKHSQKSVHSVSKTTDAADASLITYSECVAVVQPRTKNNIEDSMANDTNATDKVNVENQNSNKTHEKHRNMKCPKLIAAAESKASAVADSEQQASGRVYTNALIRDALLMFK